MINFCSSGQVFLLLPHHLCFPADQLWWLAHRLFDENPRSFIHTSFLCCKLLLPLSSICYFFIPYFCPFLITVMIFYVMQYCIHIVLTILFIFIVPSSSYEASCFYLPLGVPANFCFLFLHLDSTVNWLFSYLVFIAWMATFLCLCVADHNFLQASTVLESSMMCHFSSFTSSNSL